VFSFGFLGPGGPLALEIELAAKEALKLLVEAELPLKIVDMELCLDNPASFA
jgi:hypothetical protein